MSFLKKLFGGGEKEPPLPSKDPGPTRALRLPFAPTPEHAEKLAGQYQSAVKEFEGVDLDYSADSLKYVDQFLQRFRDEGLTVNDFAETIFFAGCYSGQVMVRHNGGQWVKQEEANLPQGIKMMPVVIKLPNGNVCDPIAKAFKRFANGQGDSLAFFHHVFTTP